MSNVCEIPCSPLYVRHFHILCINKLCQIGEDAYVYVNYHNKKQNNQQ
jgi:hypothetical protein